MGLSRLLPRPNTRSSSTKKGSSLARVIAFANQKGGVAKTTTTLNLGVALKEQGHAVLVVDLDPQGNLTMSQGWNPDEIERSMFDVLVHKLPIEEIVRQAEVDVAVSSIDLAGAELALSSMIGRERALEKALMSVKPKYDDILKENFGDLVFKTKIRKTIRYAEAPVKGQSVLGYEPSGDAAELYRDLAKEVLNGAKAREHA